MQFLHVFAYLLIALVAYTSAQKCPGAPTSANCISPRSVGRSGRFCIPRNMWHYNGRTGRCSELRYLGCYGTNNRWCTRAQCESRCRGVRRAI